VSSEPALDVDGVSVAYGDMVVVDRADLTVSQGELLVLLGPSGCGKSSLLRAIAGLEPIVSGAIRWHGSDLSGVPPHRRGFGLMFQTHALFPHLNVIDNVAFGLRMQGIGASSRRTTATEMLDLVGLAGLGARTVGTLSGGQAQRVALARALAPRPHLLLLDEPLASLDRGLRDRLGGEIRAIVRAVGATAIHVTHDHDEAVAVADRLALMDSGQILASGNFDDLKNRPGTARVARTLGVESVLDLPVKASRVLTPWGPIGDAVMGERANVLFPVDAVKAEATGQGVEARVLARLRRGENWQLRCELAVPGQGSVPLTVSAGVASPPAEGATVYLEADLGAAQILEP
jgi:thiamine transport system ATP-binding protein